MRQPFVIGVIFFVLLIGTLSGCIGPVATETITGTYHVTDATVVTVSNINGQVEITGWNGSTVELTAVKRSSVGQADLANINISAIATSNTRLDIKTTYSGPSTTQPSVDMTLKVPVNVTIGTVASSNGAIRISGIKGDAILSTSNGAITVNQVNGSVSAATSNGAVEIRGTTGITSVHTSNAAISAEVRGIRDDVTIDTSNGAITVYLSPQLNATVDASTSNARVTVQGITLNVSLLQETHMVGTLGTDGNRITIRTSNANVYIDGVATIT